MAKDAGKNPAAVALGKKRWEGTTPEERSEHARKAINARWKNTKKGKRKRAA